MRCLECAQKMPFWGEACPHCGTDKAMAQALRMISIVSLLGGVVVGAYFTGIIGLFLGGALGGAVCLAIEGLVTELFRHKKSA
jgi:hypothetical protein